MPNPPLLRKPHWCQRRLSLLLAHSLLLLSLSLLQPLGCSAAGTQQPKQQKKPLSDYSEADLERLYKQWEESDPDEESEEKRVWKSPQLDLTKMKDLTDPTLILQHSSRGQPVLLSVQVAGGLDKPALESLSHRWQLEMFNAHMETTRRVHEDGKVLLVALDGSQVAKIREYLLVQPQCHSVTIEGHTMLGPGAPESERIAASDAAGRRNASPSGKTEL